MDVTLILTEASSTSRKIQKAVLIETAFEKRNYSWENRDFPVTILGAE